MFGGSTVFKLSFGDTVVVWPPPAPYQNGLTVDKDHLERVGRQEVRDTTRTPRAVPESTYVTDDRASLRIFYEVYLFVENPKEGVWKPEKRLRKSVCMWPSD